MTTRWSELPEPEGKHVSDEQEAWQRLEIRRPGDIPFDITVLQLAERCQAASDRLLHNLAPGLFAPKSENGTAADALAQLAVEERLRQLLNGGSAFTVHIALSLGATWSQIAGALALDPAGARAILRVWVDQEYKRQGEQGAFLSAEQCHAALELLDLDDDQPASAGFPGAWPR